MNKLWAIEAICNFHSQTIQSTFSIFRNLFLFFIQQFRKAIFIKFNYFGILFLLFLLMKIQIKLNFSKISRRSVRPFQCFLGVFVEWFGKLEEDENLFFKIIMLKPGLQKQILSHQLIFVLSLRGWQTKKCCFTTVFGRRDEHKMKSGLLKLNSKKNKLFQSVIWNLRRIFESKLLTMKY